MDVEKEIIEAILKNDVNKVKNLFSEHDLKPDFCNEHGLTPLQHAAYKGNKEMVRLLLDRGADVNSGKHEFSYTALHFGALSGNVDVCQLLLESGAKPYAINSVGRTASQMAAYVGNHACSTLINNFVPKSDVDYYTKPSGFETEPKLPPVVAGPFHKFIMQVNLNPVRVTINLNKSPIMYEHIDKVKITLECMSQREMKRGLETNEIMSFKFHYLSCIVGEIINFKKSFNKNSKKSDKKAASPIEVFIKQLLKVNKEGVQEYQENLLKEIVKTFHNRECIIFRQMVFSLSRSDSPGALSIITSIVNGQRGFADSDALICATCGEEKATKKCSQCKMVQYCDRECQKYHWFVHKTECLSLASSNMNEEKKENSEQDIKEPVNAETLTSEIQNLKTS